MSIQKLILAMEKIETDFRTQIYFRMSFRTSLVVTRITPLEARAP